MKVSTKIVLLIACVAIAIGGVLILASMAKTERITPAPAATQEEEDCDKEDRAKKQWQECGLSVLVPGGAVKPTPVRTPSPKNKRSPR